MIEQEWPRALARLATNGYAVVSEIEEPELLAVARKLGRIVPDTRTGDLVRPLLPIPAELAPGNTLSSKYGTGAFPFHTEAAYLLNPVRYLILYCVRPGASHRPTILADPWHTCEPHVRQCLKQEIWLVYRNGKPFLTRIAQETLNGTLIRFDSECMRPANRINNSSFYLQNLSPVTNMVWRERDLLIVDNHRMLHARGDSPVPEDGRLLLRMLVS